MTVEVDKKSRPLFLHIFVAMLSAILMAQIISFLLIMFVGFPPPKLMTLAELADVLKEGSDQSGQFDINVGDPPAEDAQDPRDRDIRTRLASVAHVAETELRLHVSRPPFFFDFKLFRHRDPPRNDFEDQMRRADLIIGGFTAAVRLPDGRWRVIEPRQSFLEPWQLQLMSWLAGAVCAITPLAWFASRRVAKPIRLLASAAERIGRDPDAPPLVVGGPSEVVIAASALNEMQARLKRYVDDRTMTVAAIAHDLRTPLMRLALHLDDAPESVRIPAEAEIFEMRDQIQATLDFVRNVSRPARRQRLNLLSLVESIVDGFADLGADVRLEATTSITIDADVAGLKSAISNLLQNAIQYAGSARVELLSDGKYATLEVLDHGPGIPEGDLERVFEPFYRLDPSRNLNAGGTGLGLSSARSVVRAHGGDVVLLNRDGGGLIAVLSIPL